MGYDKEIYVKIKQQFSDKREGAINLSKSRHRELNMIYPEIREIDAEIDKLGLRILEIGQKYKDEDFDKKIGELKNSTMALRKKREDFLESKGLPRDYDDEHFECALCSDTGFVGINMCSCMKKALAVEGLKASGLFELSKKCTFENFDMSYYVDNQEAYCNNSNGFEYISNYAKNFTTSSKSILLLGGTGLGKTHLAVACATAVIEKGYNVVFTTANDIVNDFESKQFNRGANDEGDKTAKYFNCDLLIIDDLGSEFANTFTASVFYYLINTRINSSLPVIITTNLSSDKMRSMYDDRTFSRIIGTYHIIPLVGKDVRTKIKA